MLYDDYKRCGWQNDKFCGFCLGCFGGQYHFTSLLLIRYILSMINIDMQYMGLCVLYYHCLWLGHETVVCAVCLCLYSWICDMAWCFPRILVTGMQHYYLARYPKYDPPPPRYQIKIGSINLSHYCHVSRGYMHMLSVSYISPESWALSVLLLCNLCVIYVIVFSICVSIRCET